MEIPYLLCSSSAGNAIIMFISIMVAELVPTEAGTPFVAKPIDRGRPYPYQIRSTWYLNGVGSVADIQQLRPFQRPPQQ